MFSNPKNQTFVGKSWIFSDFYNKLIKKECNMNYKELKKPHTNVSEV